MPSPVELDDSLLPDSDDTVAVVVGSSDVDPLPSLLLPTCIGASSAGHADTHSVIASSGARSMESRLPRSDGGGTVPAGGPSSRAQLRPLRDRLSALPPRRDPV